MTAMVDELMFRQSIRAVLSSAVQAKGLSHLCTRGETEIPVLLKNI